jgi:hypothetical protein
MKITKELVEKINKLLDHGLVSGLGRPIPGHMCVEAAVCNALGLPHGDVPNCVAASVRGLKIKLNDAPWSSNMARANGLRKLSVLQLGTDSNINEAEFAHRVAMFTCCEFLPYFLRDLDEKAQWFTVELELKLRKAIDLDASDAAHAAKAAYASAAAAYAAYAASTHAAHAANAANAAKAANAAYAANASAANAYASAAAAANAAADAAANAAYAYATTADKYLIFFAKGVEDILVDMDVPGKAFI